VSIGTNPCGNDTGRGHGPLSAPGALQGIVQRRSGWKHRPELRTATYERGLVISPGGAAACATQLSLVIHCRIWQSMSLRTMRARFTGAIRGTVVTMSNGMPKWSGENAVEGCSIRLP